MQTQKARDRPGERREASRIPFRRRVRLHFGDVRTIVEATTFDISANGMFVDTSYRRPPGEALEFEIALSDGGERIEGIAEIARLRSGYTNLKRSGMGLHFRELSGPSAEIVKRVVSAGSMEREEPPG